MSRGMTNPHPERFNPVLDCSCVDGVYVEEEITPGCLVHDWDPMRDVEAFHQKFGLRYDGPVRALDADLAEFRLKFMREELHEYSKATAELTYAVAHDDGQIEPSLEDQLDALVDLVYVALGTAQLHGFNFREAWRRVHEANMKKVRATSAADSKRGHASDVVKPPDWTPPSHADLVANNLHRSRR